MDNAIIAAGGRRSISQNMIEVELITVAGLDVKCAVASWSGIRVEAKPMVVTASAVFSQMSPKDVETRHWLFRFMLEPSVTVWSMNSANLEIQFETGQPVLFELRRLPAAGPHRGAIQKVEYDTGSGILSLIGNSFGPGKTAHVEIMAEGRLLEVCPANEPLPYFISRGVDPKTAVGGWRFEGECGLRVGTVITATGFDAGGIPLFRLKRVLQRDEIIRAYGPRTGSVRKREREILKRGFAAIEKLDEDGLRALLESRKFWKKWRSQTGPRWRMRTFAAKKYAQRGLRSGFSIIPIRLIDGSVVICDPGDDAVIARKFLIGADYEPGTRGVLESLLRPGDHFVDGGACYGHMSLLALRLVGNAGRVSSIEANPVMAERLRRTWALNDVKTIMLYDAALSDAKQELTFSADPSNLGGSRLAGKSDHPVGQGKFTRVVSIDPASWGGAEFVESASLKPSLCKVQAVILDDILAAMGKPETPGAIILIKLDLEGYEPAAVRGASKAINGSTRPLFLIEEGDLTSLPDDPSSQMTRILLEAGYTKFKSKAGKSTDFMGFELAMDPLEELAFDNYLYVPSEHLDRVPLGH